MVIIATVREYLGPATVLVEEISIIGGFGILSFETGEERERGERGRGRERERGGERERKREREGERGRGRERKREGERERGRERQRVGATRERNSKKHKIQNCYDYFLTRQ